jgi:PKD repeat protein
LCDTKYDYLKLRKEAQFNITSKLRGEIFNLKYIWDFGDGSNPTTSNLNHVKKQFANPGKYKVCVKDELCSDSTNIFCDSIEITNDTPIVADFSYRQDVEGEITFFNKSTSKSPIGKIFVDLLKSLLPLEIGAMFKLNGVEITLSTLPLIKPVLFIVSE